MRQSKKKPDWKGEGGIEDTWMPVWGGLVQQEKKKKKVGQKISVNPFRQKLIFTKYSVSST